MRPVSKGSSPKPNCSHYRNAFDDLEDRIGLFCSYCEQPIQHAPEVEHVQPKSLEPHLERCWNDLLLGCSSCSKTKSGKPVILAQVAIPDTDSTLMGLVFGEGGTVGLSPHLTDEQTKLMRNVVSIVRLDRHPNAKKKDDRPRRGDKCAKLRSEVWILANRYLGCIEQPVRDPLMRKCTAEDLAPSKGFFSIWMTVFQNHPDMLKRFIRAFRGTDTNGFDSKGQAMYRPGGRLGR